MSLLILLFTPSVLFTSFWPSHIILILKSSASPTNPSAPKIESPSFDPADEPYHVPVLFPLVNCFPQTPPHLWGSLLLYLPAFHQGQKSQLPQSKTLLPPFPSHPFNPGHPQNQIAQWATFLLAFVMLDSVKNCLQPSPQPYSLKRLPEFPLVFMSQSSLVSLSLSHVEKCLDFFILIPTTLVKQFQYLM